MKNYQSSDYALNKYSEGIMYRFANEIVAITLTDYLADNPHKTAQDFLELKALSDAIWREQDRAEYNQTRKNVPIHDLEEFAYFGGASLDEELLDALDKEAAAQAFAALLTGGRLTETQEQRFRMYVFQGLTQREIAALEGVNHRAVGFSVNAAIAMLKKYFGKF